MSRVKIVIDDDISRELIALYKESTTDEFVGTGGAILTDKEIIEDLKSFLSTNKESRMPRLGIMKIYFLGNIVGFSIPRGIVEREYPAFEIHDKLKWYRVGTVFISKRYRGLGIMKESLQLFVSIYKNVLWSCNVRNIASERSALSAGLKFSHYIYHGKNGKWSLEPFRGVLLTTKIFKTA